MLRFTPFALLFALALPVAAQSPAELLEKAATQARLTDIDKPWHAKLAMTVYDSKGQNPVEGTFEYWQVDADSLYTITLGEAHRTVLQHGGKIFEKESPSSLLQTAEELFGHFLHSDPEPLGPARTIAQRKQNFGKATLTCLMLGPDVLNMEQTPLGLFPTYCLEPDTAVLRLSYSLGSQQFSINRVGKFLGHSVPMEFTLGENGTVIAKAKVTEMATFTVTPEFFSPTPDLMVSAPATARIASGVIAGAKISGEQPHYPVSARQAHVQGSVVLRAIISRDGHILSLRVISTPSVDLAIASLAAVRTWRYKPYRLNGAPTDVDTTIVVNFNLSPA